MVDYDETDLAEDMAALVGGAVSPRTRGSGSSELEDYATFIRREMPVLVRRELEFLLQRDEFRDIEERLRPQVAQLVLELQPRLLGLYKQSQLPLSEYGPPQPFPDVTTGNYYDQGLGLGGDTDGGASEVEGLTPAFSASLSPGSRSGSGGAGIGSTPQFVQGEFTAGRAGDDAFYLGHGEHQMGAPGAAAGLGEVFNPGYDLSGLGMGFHTLEQTGSAVVTGNGAGQGAVGGNGLPKSGNAPLELDWAYEFDQLLKPSLMVPSGFRG